MSTSWSRVTWRSALTVLGTTALVAGCGSTATPYVPIAPDAPTVTVTMTEFRFVVNPLPRSAGSYKFHVVNAGTTAHEIVLTGSGIADQKTPVLQPGESADLPTVLQTGDYDLYCPIDGHRAKGMDTHFTLGVAAVTPSATPAPSAGDAGGY